MLAHSPPPKGNAEARVGATASETSGKQVRCEDSAKVASAQVARLRLTARCLDLSPVFVGDMPLVAELFNGRGRQVETWVWP
jgi:hypothetical protein